MYTTISKKNYTNLRGFSIGTVGELSIGQKVHLVRSRLNLDINKTDYSMDTDCEVLGIDGHRVTLDNHKPENNIVYYYFAAPVMTSASKSGPYIYNQFLIRSDTDCLTLMDKDIFHVMLCEEVEVQGMVTKIVHAIPVLADSEDEAVEIIKGESKVTYNFANMGSGFRSVI